MLSPRDASHAWLRSCTTSTSQPYQQHLPLQTWHMGCCCILCLIAIRMHTTTSTGTGTTHSIIQLSFHAPHHDSPPCSSTCAAPPPPPPPPPEYGALDLMATAVLGAAATRTPASIAFGKATSMTSQDGRYALNWDPLVRKLSFTDKASDSLLWTAGVTKTSFAPPIKLSLSTDGALQLLDAKDAVLWTSGTEKIGLAPYKLQILDGALIIADMKNSSTWTAPSMCGGLQLSFWDQCGGTQCGDINAMKGIPCKDTPYPQSCCPAGWQCKRSNKAWWQCTPSTAITRCTGNKVIPRFQACGGVSMCGKDATCTNSCCVAGAYCARQSPQRWECSPVPDKPNK